MCRLLKILKKQVRTSTLPRAMREYWKVFHRIESIGCHRGEQLAFLKKIIKKSCRNVLFRRKCGFMLWRKSICLILCCLLIAKSI